MRGWVSLTSSADNTAILEPVPGSERPAADFVPLEQRAAPAGRARSHRRFVPPFIHFISGSLTYSVLLFLKRQCDRTPAAGVAPAAALAAAAAPGVPAGAVRRLLAQAVDALLVVTLSCMVRVGLARVAASCHRPPTLHQSREYLRRLCL